MTSSTTRAFMAKKQSTSFTQVANNLLNVLQGYSKTIRLLLVMFLTLTVIINAQAETIASWGCISISANTNYKAIDGDANNKNVAQFSSSKAMTSTGTNAYYGSSAGGAVITFSNLDLSNYTDVMIYFYSRASQGGNFSLSYSTNGTSFNSGNSSGTLATKNTPTQYSIALPSNSEDITTLKLSHSKSSGSLYFGTVTITGTKKAAASYTITPQSNNTSYGTVSLSGTTITATPNAGYRVKSGDAGYSIAAGSATVINNGDNTFSVTPSTDCTITINFEVIPTFTVNWYVNGIRTYSQTDVAGMLLTNIPNLEDYECGDKVFVGWTTQSSYEHANDAPAGMITNTFGITMPEGGENYYAVFAEGSGDAVETSIAGGDWSNGATSEWTTHDKNTYSNNGVKFDSTSDYVLSPNIATSGYTELLLKFKAGYNGSQGSVLTIYAYDEEIVLLSDDQVTISPSTVTPDVEYTDQTKTYQVSISAKKTIGKIMIQMTSRTSNLGMKYCELFAISSQHQNYTTQCSNKPSVSFDLNGGSGTFETETLKDGDSYTIPDIEPTRDGYNFAGWKIQDGDETIYKYGTTNSTIQNITADITLVAQWTPITYTITLNSGTGTCDNDKISGTYSNGVVLPTASPSDICAEEGWTFAGWTKTSIIEETTTSPDPLYVAGSTYNPTTNIELYAVYVKQTFTLSLVDNSTTYYVGGYESSKSILTAETDVNNAMDFRIVDGQYLRCESGYISHNSASSTNISCYPSKDGNVFPWTITENTGTISFQSTKAEGNIRYLGYNYNRGNPRFAVYVESYAHNFTKNTTTTYTTDPNCCTPLDEITGLTFSAMTRSITVSVPDSYDNTNVDGYIFNLYNAATGGVATTYDTNDKNEKSHTFTGLTPNTAYHFTIIAKGSGAYCNSAETSPRESHTTLPQYTVTWNPAGGNWSGSTADKVDTYDYQAEITKPADPERKGYTFNGWNTTPATTMPAENLTYTAQWNIVTYTITYENLNGATHTNPEEYTVETAAITLTDPTERAGYVFAGWYSDAECTTEVTEIPNGSTGNITLYAKWLQIFTITWKANGLEYETTKVTEGDPIIPPSSPDLGDYCGQVFAGWTDAEMAETNNVAPTLYPNPTPFPTATEESPTTFYAVFADYDEQQ